MEKRGLVLTFVSVFLSVMLINIVSAQFYGGFSLSNMLNSIDPSTMILGTIFIISFALLNFSLSKFFRGNAGIAGIVAFAVSLLIVWGINQTGFDYSGLFYNIFFFIPEDLLYTLIPFLLLGLIIYGFFKLGPGETLAILGGFLLAISFTELVYEKGLVGSIGAILLGFGLWRMLRKKKPGLADNISSRASYTGKRTLEGAKTAGRFAQDRWKQRQEKQAYARDRRAAEKENYTRDRAAAEKENAQIQAQQEKKQLLLEDKRKNQLLLEDKRKKDREINDLRKKHFKYRRAAEGIVKKVGHIPKKGTPEYKKWKNYTNAVETIEKMAKKRGEKLF